MRLTLPSPFLSTSGTVAWILSWRTLDRSNWVGGGGGGAGEGWMVHEEPLLMVHRGGLTDEEDAKYG